MHKYKENELIQTVKDIEYPGQTTISKGSYGRIRFIHSDGIYSIIIYGHKRLYYVTEDEIACINALKRLQLRYGRKNK